MIRAFALFLLCVMALALVALPWMIETAGAQRMEAYPKGSCVADVSQCSEPGGNCDPCAGAVPVEVDGVRWVRGEPSCPDCVPWIPQRRIQVQTFCWGLESSTTLAGTSWADPAYVARSTQPGREYVVLVYEDEPNRCPPKP